MLRGLPMTSETLGPPKGFWPTTSQWLESLSGAAAAARVHDIVAESRSVRPPPATIDGQVPWQFDAYYGGRTGHDPPGWVLLLAQGRVAGNGAVITPDDRLLADVSREAIVGNDQSKHSILRRVRLGRPERLPGTVAVLSVSSTNYWHWFFDLLPRVLLLEAMPGGLDAVDWFVVNELRADFQAETLELLGVPAGKLLESHQRFHIKADTLLVPSVFLEVPSARACRILRQRFSGALSSTATALARRPVYISRADAKKRRVMEEEVLLERLAEFGFVEYTLQGKSILEQYEIFSSAEIVLAPHGAGLTNLLFCREGTPVVELFPPTYVNPCYWVLAANLGLPYFCHVGEGPTPPPPPPGADHDEWFHSFTRADRSHGRHIQVKTDGLLALLDQALSVASPNAAGS
jgi:capsular polysaccharide biosynthesis protein